MWLVVGLGNPGRDYYATRHNIGFMVVDALAQKWQETNWRTRFDALVVEHKVYEPVVLVKPQTYMNLSGIAVGALVRWYKIPPERIIVVCDDLDLSVGRLRLREKGSSGGHRGVESLLVHLGHEKFYRIKVGIGRPPEGWQVSDYVTSRFRTEELAEVTEVIKLGSEAIEMIISEGLIKAMTKYNK